MTDKASRGLGINRRHLFGFLVAPAIVHAGNLMPISVPWMSTNEAMATVRQEFGEGMIYFGNAVDGPGCIRMIQVKDNSIDHSHAVCIDSSKMSTADIMKNARAAPIIGRGRYVQIHHSYYNWKWRLTA